MDIIGPKRINNKGKVIKFEQEGECVVCTSHEPTVDGYVRVYAGRGEHPRMQLMHRIVWTKEMGEIPKGFELDHICRNRRCCNTKHLQLLTVSEHKSKTNRERYADRISRIEVMIENGISTKDIAKEVGVTTHTVTRIKRKGKLND